MNKKLILVILIFMAIPILLVNNSLKPTKLLPYMEDPTSLEGTSDMIVVGFSQLGSESEWRTANTKSIQGALTESLGFSLIYKNGRQSQENQIKDVRSFIFQEVDYILIAPATETGWDTVLEEAKEAGIPVIIVDRMIATSNQSLYVAHVGTDKYEEGQKAGRWLEQDLITKHRKSGKDMSSLEDEAVNIVVLEGTPNSTAQLGRSNGFNNIALSHDNWHILANESGDFTKAKGKEVMVKYLEDFEDIDVVVSQNDDMTFGAIEAIMEAGRTCGVDGEITIISFDAVSEAFDKMEEGLIDVDIECNPLQGPLIATIIKEIEKGAQVKKVSYVDEKVFEAKNASQDRIDRIY